MILNSRKILFFSFVVLIFLNFSGCSSDEKSPPKAGFTVSDENPVQWDVVYLTDRSSESTTTAYQITGGEFVLSDDLTAIIFLEDHTYTITQLVMNDQGKDEYSVTLQVAPPDNVYTIDNVEIPIVSEPIFKKESNKASIRFINEVTGQQNPDYISLFPIPGSNPLESTYLYEGLGEITGTYLMRIVKDFNADLNAYEWIMDYEGNDGEGNLVIDLIYEDRLDPANNVYDISVESYTLSTGYFDFISGSGFIEENKRSFSISYRGKFDR